MYCESKIDSVSYGDVEHIKPKTHYPELKFEWQNLGYVCTLCNNEKRDSYDESCPLINPYDENPDDYLIAGGYYILSKQGHERGELTILTINLNRAGLVESRRERYNKLNSAVQACFRTKNPQIKEELLKALVTEADDDREFSMMAKQLLQQHEVLSTV